MYTDQDIKALTNLVIEKIQPEKIILFGSYAYGNPTEESDIDLLVIKNNDSEISLELENEYDFKVYKGRKEKGIKVRTDIFYRTQKQAEEIAENGGAFSDALKKGLILYEYKYN